MDSEYSVTERLLTQAKVHNKETPTLATEEYSRAPHTVCSGQVVYYVTCN